MRVLAREDPDRVSLLLPSPSVDVAYDDIIATEIAPIVSRYRIPQEECLRVRTGDAVAAWRALEEKDKEWCEENIYLLPCGPKSHSLALSLYAISKQTPTVLCIIPAKYSFVDAHANGLYWTYTIEDLSSPRTES